MYSLKHWYLYGHGAISLIWVRGWEIEESPLLKGHSDKEGSRLWMRGGLFEGEIDQSKNVTPPVGNVSNWRRTKIREVRSLQRSGEGN